MKKIISIILMLIICISNLSAAGLNSLSVGGRYEPAHHTEERAETFSKYAKQLGYSGITAINPNKYTFSTKYVIPYAVALGGILYFTGEGKPKEMYWNYMKQGGDNAVGIKTENYNGQSGYSYFGLNTFNMNYTDMVIFMGCHTSDPSVSGNLVDTAYNQGAKLSIGYPTYIYDETGKWMELFMKNLINGKTIKESLKSADSGWGWSYASTTQYTVKIAKSNYENLTLAQLRNASKSTQSIENILTSNTFKLKNNKQLIDLDKKNITQDDITEYIKNTYNLENIEDYKIEYSNNGLYETYRYVLMAGEFRTNKGYLVFVDDEIEIVDYMPKYPTNNLTKITSSENLANEKTIIENILKEYKDYYKDNLDKEITLKSTIKHYDVDNNKFYLDINILLHDIKENTNYISTKTVEL